MRKILPAVLAALVVGTGAAAAQTSPQGGPVVRPNWEAPHLPTGQGGVITMNEDDVRTKLAAEGYTNISNLRREGNIYNAMAVKDRSNKRLSIDARSGAVLAEIDAP
jgi:hypothetical protein